MKTQEIKIDKRFSGSTIGTVHQTGMELTKRRNGVNVSLHLRDGIPVMAEVYDDDCVEYAEIGLESRTTKEGKIVVEGYDGVFELPGEVITLLVENGFEVNLD